MGIYHCPFITRDPEASKTQSPNLKNKNFAMKYMLDAFLATLGVMVVTALSIKVLVLGHPVWAGLLFFGGFYLLRKAFRKYLHP